MIKIHLSKKTYLRLQEEYLKIIVKFVAFDKRDILSDATLPEEGKTKHTAAKLKQNYPELYNFLFEENSDKVRKENLKMLLVGPSNMPNSFGGDGGDFKTMNDFFKWINSECTPLYKENAFKSCKSIFRYNNGFGKSKDPYELLRILDVRVCPYCNRIYTITLPSKKELKDVKKFKSTRATFDHFYSQNNYPYLALNLFNLIPSCHICNNNKRDSEEKIVYPYDEDFGEDAMFRVIPDLEAVIAKEESNPFAFLLGESDDFDIKFMAKKEFSLLKNTPLSYRLSDVGDEEHLKRIENSIKLFCLEEQYKEHKTEIKDILRNRYYFNEQYVRSVICPLLQKKMEKDGKNNMDQEQIRDMAMDMLFFTRLNQDEWGERPLSKLKADILEQISVIEYY